MRSVYERLDANKSPDTMVIENSRDFRRAIAEIQASWEKVSLGIGWGGAYGESSYKIVLELLKTWIEPVEYVGNSAGAIISTLFALGYQDEKYVDYFFSGLSKNISFKDIPLILIAKLIPFVIDFPEEYKVLQEKLYKENDSFFQYMKNISLKEIFINGELSVKAIEKAICGFLGMNMKPLSLRKINFNDVKTGGFGNRVTGEWVNLRVIAWAMTDSTTSIKRGMRRYAEGNNGMIRAIQFRWSYPVFDAVFASACPWIPKKTNIKGSQFTLMDGYMAWQNFPSGSGYFTKWNTNVTIHTDDDFILTKLILPDYGENLKYVIRPDMRGGDAFGTSQEARKLVQDAANRIIGD